MIFLKTNGDFNIDNGLNDRLERLLDQGYHNFEESLQFKMPRQDAQAVMHYFSATARDYLLKKLGFNVLEHEGDCRDLSTHYEVQTHHVQELANQAFSGIAENLKEMERELEEAASICLEVAQDEERPRKRSRLEERSTRVMLGDLVATHFAKRYPFVDNAEMIKNAIEKLKYGAAHFDIKVEGKSIRESLNCGICHDTFIDPYSLKCGHSFCQICINKVLRTQKNCPDCHQIVLRKPYANRIVGQLVEQVISKQRQETQQAYRERQRLQVETRQNRIARYKARASQVKEGGARMLNILDAWDLRQKEVFRIGYDKYDGAERIAYCEEIGFTKGLIESATDEMIAVMLGNLGLEVPRYISVVPIRYNYEMGRSILLNVLEE